MEIWEAKN